MYLAMNRQTAQKAMRENTRNLGHEARVILLFTRKSCFECRTQVSILFLLYLSEMFIILKISSGNVEVTTDT